MLREKDLPDLKLVGAKNRKRRGRERTSGVTKRLDET
jgi:hypothetical protein